MPNLLEYFNNDFKELSMDTKLNLTIYPRDKSKETFEDRTIEINQRIRINVNASTRLFTYYIPESQDTALIIKGLIQNFDQNIGIAEGLSAVGSFMKDVEFGKHVNSYSRRIYVYAESELSPDELLMLTEVALSKTLYLTIRGNKYVQERTRTEIPIGFISHDSRDKVLIASPLAHGLSSRLCTVWYDEFSLKAGDSLIQSIEKGIKEAKKCVLILTKNYLSNPGWGKKEFDSIFTREMIKEEKIMIPIWYDISKNDVYEYSPSLADTFALTWPKQDGLTKEEYQKKVEIVISKVHSALTS